MKIRMLTLFGETQEIVGKRHEKEEEKRKFWSDSSRVKTIVLHFADYK